MRMPQSSGVRLAQHSWAQQWLHVATSKRVNWAQHPFESGLGPGPFFPLLTVARGASLQVFACCCLLLASQQPSAWEAADRQLLATSLAACAVAAAACIAWHALTCAEHGPSYAYLRCMEVVSLALRMGVALAWPPLLRCGILLPAFRQPAACPPTACL